MIIPRQIEAELVKSIDNYPVTTILGPRQSGKSTLVKTKFPAKVYVNLEMPDDRRAIMQDPRAFIESVPNVGVIIDEIQRFPELLSYIQVFVDEHKNNGQFILTGSHQVELHEEISQSLAGRTSILRLLPLSIYEILNANIELDSDVDNIMLRGFFPKLFSTELEAHRYYQDYIATYIERDVRKMVNVKDLGMFQDFLRLLAGRVGQILNIVSLGNDLGLSNHTITNWISILEASYIGFRIRPYFENFGKRIIKSPKFYFSDVGLLCNLLGIENQTQLSRDPLRGSIYENMVLLELIKYRYNIGKEHNMYFYRDSHQNEIDVVYKNSSLLIPIEIKAAKTYSPQFTDGIEYLQKLVSERVPYGYVIYSGVNRAAVGDCRIINFKNSTYIFND
jgi:predicted AAA+ superfamily ATPase